MLTGCPPYEGQTSFEILARTKADIRPADVLRLPVWLATWCGEDYKCGTSPMPADDDQSCDEVLDRHFPTTMWTVVTLAGETRSPQAQNALAKLCQAYW